MLLLIQILGIQEYIIWDKAAHIEFKKPVRTTLTFRFRITDEDLQKIQADLASTGKSLPEFKVDGCDRQGDVCVEVTNIIYIRKKEK
jgi:hypothetical protein